jgi:hypothetical protein
MKCVYSLYAFIADITADKVDLFNLFDLRPFLSGYRTLTAHSTATTPANATRCDGPI